MFRSILFLCIAISTCAATYVWDRNPETNVTEYIVWDGLLPGIYTESFSASNETSFEVDGIVADGLTHYFAVTARDSDGLESDFSGEASYEPYRSPQFFFETSTNLVNWITLAIWKTNVAEPHRFFRTRMIR